MSNCNEVLFVSDDTGHMQSASCFDPQIGTTLMLYKGGGPIPSNTLSYVGNDFIISASVGKLMLNIWRVNSSELDPSVRVVVAGKVTALAVSPDGLYCTAGIEGKIYIWHISSGTLLNVVSRHYQDIRKILFTNDSSHFITGGSDGHVFVWRLANVAQRETGSAFDKGHFNKEPVYSLLHHSLPVTDMFLGHGNMHARLFTVSVDQTCKIYSLTDGSLLLSIVFEFVLSSVLVNCLETTLFVGTECGKIVLFGLDPYPRSLEHHTTEKETEKMLVGHSKAISCLSASIDGFTIASGSEDARVIIWDVKSLQQLRTFDMKGPVTNLAFKVPSVNLFSNEFVPILSMSNFKRTAVETDFEADVLVNQTLTPLSYADEFEGPARIVSNMQAKRENEEELAHLKQEVETLKKSNKELYLFAMEKILNNPMGSVKNKVPSVTQ